MIIENIVWTVSTSHAVIFRKKITVTVTVNQSQKDTPCPALLITSLEIFCTLTIFLHAHPQVLYCTCLICKGVVAFTRHVDRRTEWFLYTSQNFVYEGIKMSKNSLQKVTDSRKLPSLEYYATYFYESLFHIFEYHISCSSSVLVSKSLAVSSWLLGVGSLMELHRTMVKYIAAPETWINLTLNLIKDVRFVFSILRLNNGMNPTLKLDVFDND